MSSLNHHHHFGLISTDYQSQDLLALASAVGLSDVESSENGPNDLPNHQSDFEQSAKTLQQAILLLRYQRAASKGNGSSEPRQFDQLDRRKITRVATLDGVRFAHIQVDLNEALVIQDDSPAAERSSECLEMIRHVKESSEESELIENLRSSWFIDFIARCINTSYPMDRFTLLTAIWIISVECRHSSLEQLANELVDRLAHEETSSGSLEDLLRLSQLGAIWLSRHKRHQVTHLNRVESKSSEPQLVESDEESNLSVSGSNSSSSQNGSASDRRSARSAPIEPINSRRKLRQLIDNELIFGSRCPVCSERQSNQLFACLELDFCPSCSSRMSLERCSLSFRAIPIVGLASLLAFRPKLERLLILNASEWLRMILRARSRTDGDSKGESESRAKIERVDISDNFERLTMIRRNSDRNSTDSSATIEESQSESEEDSDLQFGSKSKPEIGQTDEEIGAAEPIATLSRFLESRLASRKAKQSDDQASESVDSIRCSPPSSTFLVLNGSDLLLLESQTSLADLNLVRVGLSASNEWRRFGNILGCQSRSSASQLLLGCGRLFCSFELLRVAGDLSLCPFCSRELSRVSNANDFFETL